MAILFFCEISARDSTLRDGLCKPYVRNFRSDGYSTVQLLLALPMIYDTWLGCPPFFPNLYSATCNYYYGQRVGSCHGRSVWLV